MSDTFKGWQYISAIFNTFCKMYGSEHSASYISPRFIFRGISKRYFTESVLLNEILLNKDKQVQEIRKAIEKGEQDFEKIKSRRKESEWKNIRVQCIYERLYQKFRDKINRENEKLATKAEDLKLALRHFNSKVENSQQIILDDATVELQVNMDYLKTVVDSMTMYKVCPELIRSGASIRLRDTTRDYSTVADYLSYIRNLIDGFKLVNPDFKLFNELEILAEIQHRGGGSCLVDFSNDFLISLWFASNNNSSEVGYLFCYDVNEDALQDDNLTYLTRDRSSLDIEALLRKTRKTTRYAGDDKHRFWLWRPANLNGRIARQDSVFVFGIEKFEIERHSVKVIPIPPLWKEDICKALKVYFGTTAEVVFPDIDGYANANSKLEKIPLQTQYFNTDGYGISNPEYIQKGMSCLLKGNYQLSLDYLQKWIAGDNRIRSKTNTQYDTSMDMNLRKIHIEVFYSIGFCYMRLHKPNIAINYFHKAFTECYNILSSKEISDDFQEINSFNDLRGNLNNFEEHQFSTKLYKIVEDYIKALSILKEFSTILKLVDLLINSFKGVEDVDSMMTVLISMRNNATILNCYYLSAIDGGKEGRKCILKSSNAKSDSFLYVLKYFFLFLQSCYNNPEDVCFTSNSNSEVKDRYNRLLAVISNAKQKGNLISNISWNYDIIKDVVSVYFNGDINAMSHIEYAIAQLEDLQSIIQANKKV